MRYYPCKTPYISQEEPHTWNLYCRKEDLSWHRKALQTNQAINYYRDLDMAHVDFVYNKDLRIKDWYTPRRRRAACLPIYYGSGIERPLSKYDYEKYKKLLAILEQQKTPPAKSNRPRDVRKKKRERTNENKTKKT